MKHTANEWQQSERGGMSEWITIAAGSLSVAVLGVLGWVAKVLTNLPNDYMPRDQVNSRFEKVEQKFHDDMEAAESRSDKRFDRLEHNLDEGFRRVLDKLDGKADK